jgi:hypothetical protein
MTNELFERLLYEEEGTTIDFKKEQYRFVKATDEEKSELLKDILGFANAFRRSATYKRRLPITHLGRDASLPTSFTSSWRHPGGSKGHRSAPRHCS